MHQIKVIITGAVSIIGLPAQKEFLIKSDLTYDNPKYTQAVRSGRFLGYTDQYVYFFRETTNSLIVPRGYLNKLLNFHLKGCDVLVIDKIVAPTIAIEWTGELREYQDTAVQDVLKQRYGILEADTGAGKTVCGVSLIAARKLKALVLVHNKELLYQWVEAIQKFTDCTEIGIIGDSKFNIKDVTIGIINSVHNHRESLKNEFGNIIYDECHRILASTWLETINTLRPFAHTGLSATPFRNNKTTKALFYVCGPLQHKVNTKHLREVGAVLVPEIIRVQTDFWAECNDYTKLMSALTQDYNRALLVVETVLKDLRMYNEPIMIVSDRVAHCELIHAMLFEYKEARSIVLHSGVPSLTRKQLVKQIKDGTANVLIATLNLLGEGFDAPHLSAAFLTTPIKFKGRLKQIIGRVLRPSGGHKPRVYDFRDNLIKVLRLSGWSRDKVYKSEGWNYE